MNNLYKFLTIVVIFTLSKSLIADDLQRRAQWHASFSKLEHPGVLIRNISDISALKAAGLKENDIILKVNAQSVVSQEVWNDISDSLISGREYLLLVREHGTRNLNSHKLTFQAVPFEQHQGLETIYETVTSDYGNRQRVIITKPSTEEPQPAVIFLQGLSCSSIELIPNRRNNYLRLIEDIVQKSEVVVMRVEKPGVGDSEGHCSDTDFTAELNGYETAVQHLLSKDYVDKTKVVVYGNSMGSALAPYIANKYNLSGVISDGTYLRTWFEHMLEIERRIRKMQGDSQSEITQKMNHAYIPLYYGMLIEKKSYADMIKENPLLAGYNYHGLNHMYGRSMSFYHQLQEFDIAGAWEKLEVPARIRWGTHDWIMSEYDNDMIVEILQSSGHQDHTLLKYPMMDHWSTIHKSYESSFKGEKGAWDPKVSGQILDWIKELTE
ncbi:MAG: alpha/beta hydrolase [Kangiellaceae bacterium]|nr:alpha/beta hydrolase [Kangiellaceae bacterium]